MLHRSFKPAKCKTTLKLAIPRIKLMKNKREALVKQLKRELAQLLESGQDQTARIRVEHVVREEKTVAAYNLLEIYCELIVARMPIIESQKNCPTDLKEAISSIIFASARCGEIPELKDVSKHFTAKYGKEFISAALEVRPNCGVSRMLVEKLSTNAPDGPTKLKILTAIAEEHNIKWDPESFQAKEAKIHEDLLNGPSTFKESTKNLADSLKQASATHYEERRIVQVPNHNKGSPDVQPPKDSGKNDVPSSNYEHSSGSPPYPKNLDSSNSSASNSMSSGAYPSNPKPYGTEIQGMEFRNSYSGNESAFSSPRSHWNMEFKDATAAAQAAAESAERASMAARAAAELSSRENISQQYTTGSHMSSGTRDEEQWKYTGSDSRSEHHARHRVDTSFHGKIPRNHEQTCSNEQQNQGGDAENVYSDIVRGSDKSTDGSFMATAASFNEKPSLSNQITYAYSQRNSSEGKQMDHFSKVSIKRNSGENEMPFANELHGSRNSRNVDHDEIRVQEHPCYSSSGSHVNSSDDDLDVVSNLSWQKTENDKRNLGQTGMRFVNEVRDIKNSENAHSHEVGISKQSSDSSSHFHSSTYTDHGVVSNLNSQKSGTNNVEDSFLINDEAFLKRNTKETADSYDNASAVFDDYGTDNDEYTFDLEKEHKGHDNSRNFSSPCQRSPAHPFTSVNTWSSEQSAMSPGRSISQSHMFSEQQSTPVFLESSTSSAVPSHGEDLHADFDNYGSSSESEEEVDKSKFVRSSDSSRHDLPADFDNYGSSSESKEEVDKSKFIRSSDPSRHDDTENIDSQQAESSIYTPQLAEGVEDAEPIKKLDLEESKELNYGNLTGGLRNKGYKHPPYMKIPQVNALQSGDAAVGASVRSGSYNQDSNGRKGTTEVNRKLSTKAPITREDSSDDDSEEEHLKQPFGSTHHKNKIPSFEANKRSSSKVPVPYFDSANSDSDDDLPKATPNARISSGFSRRTKASSSGSQRSSILKNTVSYDTSYNAGKKYSLRSSNANESQPETQPQKKNSDHLDVAQPKIQPQEKNSDHRAEAQPKTQPQKKNSDHWDEAQPNTQPQIKDLDHWKEAHSKTRSQKKDSDHWDEAQPKTLSQPQKDSSDKWESHQHSELATQTASRLVSEAKTSSLDRTSKSSEKEQQPSTGNAQNSKPQMAFGGSSKGSASHVHPKLPDYDTFISHLSSLKQNRQ